MSLSDRLDIRAIIKFCHDLGKTPTQTLKMIEQTKREHSVSRALVCKWHRRFSNGQDSLEEQQGRGRKKQYGATIMTSVHDALAAERRLTIRELVERFDMGYGTIHRILTEDLQMSKVHARWIPRLLKEDEKERRVHDSRVFLRRFKREADRFLNQIITTDETWLWLHDPETKQQSAVWKRSDSSPPEKARVSKSGGKFMFIMFCNRKGMLLQHAVTRDATVNAAYYSKVLRRNLVHTLQKKRPGIPLEDFLLHQDNAPPHTAQMTTLEIGVLGFNAISHPPYSPDLAPMDFAIFPTVKKQLKGMRFLSLHELRAANNRIVAQYDQQWYEDVFEQWIHRHRRCVECEGRYFEKK